MYVDGDKLDYEKLFFYLVEKTKEYVVNNNLKSMVLGISGGIDSTLVAAICHEVSLQTGIPLIGRSLKIKNKNDEFDVSKLVGEAFCTDFKIINLKSLYNRIQYEISFKEYGYAIYDEKPIDIIVPLREIQTPIANGNIQARLRMIYLYNLASVNKGIVLSTDNQTEFQLGFWTIHGDEGDFDPLLCLWKTEVYEMVKWLIGYNTEVMEERKLDGLFDEANEYLAEITALSESSKLVPTDGLGISNSDLEQIGTKSYEDTEMILKMIIASPKGTTSTDFMYNAYKRHFGEDVFNKVYNRHKNSEFKRNRKPFYIEIVRDNFVKKD